MGLTAEQELFAAEFVTLVVTVAAIALVVLRPALQQARQAGGGRETPAGGGWPAGAAATTATALLLALLAAVAFAHGGLLVTGNHAKDLGVARAAAGGLLAFVLLAALARSRRNGPWAAARMLPAAGALLWAVAGAIEAAGGPNVAIDGLLVAGSVLAAASVFGAAQRSVAVRVAAGAAASLLLVVVVLALALSTVISSSLQREQLSRLAARAQVEEAAATDTSAVAIPARLVEADLADWTAQGSNPLVSFATGSATERAQAATAISQHLASLEQAAGQVGGAQSGVTIGYTDVSGSELLGPTGSPVGIPGGFGAGGLKPPSCSSGRAGDFTYAGGVALAASSPVCTSTASPLGAVVAIEPLDAAYLANRRQVDPSTAIALVLDGRVISAEGMTPAAARADAEGFGSDVTGRTAQTAARGDRYVADAAIAVAGTPERLDLVLASAETTVLSARNQLFRTLFLIAFGGTVVALGLAVFTGDRITAGLRRLTAVASGIGAGHSGVRAKVGGSDEVAVLGSTFDAMLDAVAEQSEALRLAAIDEARLRGRLEAVVAGMEDGLVAVDPDGRITDFNRAAESLTGTPSSAAVGAPAESVVRLDLGEGAAAKKPFFTPTRRRQTMTATLTGPDGDIPVAVSTGLLAGPSREPAGAVLVLRDLRREQEIERVKSEFLSRVGHELRTPLTGILGYADILLRRDVGSERSRMFHDEILHSARRLLRIVEMLEFFANEAAGRIVLRPEETDVREIVASVADGWAQRVPPNVEIARRLGRGRAVVNADARWLRLAIDELMDNAVKFSPDGGRIRVAVSADESGAEISVKDPGTGMSLEDQQHIFDDFVQADASDTRRFGGLGLGLAIARRVVEGHGGTIECRSAPGKGSTFTIRVPARRRGREGRSPKR